MEQRQETQREEVSEPKPSILQRARSSLIAVTAFMIATGQWNDTKDLLTSLYEDALANFTHSIEYDLLSRIHVGNSLDYVKFLVGEPYAIKRSKLNPKFQFHYYNQDKFGLTLISQDGRLVGYSVYTKMDGFAPSIPFAEELGSANLAKLNEEVHQFNFDTTNLVYYTEAQELGKQQMFLSLVRGYVEYGAIADTGLVEENYREQVAETIVQLDRAETFATDEQPSQQPLQKLRKLVYPNYFSISELEPGIVAESILTRYEHKMLTQS